MLKLIIFSLLGKNFVSSRVLFNSIKSYLILYMLILPAFLNVGVLANNFVGQDGDSVTEMMVERHRTFSIPGLQGTDEENEIIGKEYADCYHPEFSPAY